MLNRASRAIIVVVLLAAGCAYDPSPGLDHRNGELVDMLGRRVRFKQPAKRIVSLSPGVTELLFAVGAGESVVGVTIYDDYPSEVAKIDKVGGFRPKDVNLEKVVALKPDLVLIAGGIQTPLVTKIERFGIPVFVMDAEEVDDVFHNIKLVGEMTGHS